MLYFLFSQSLLPLEYNFHLKKYFVWFDQRFILSAKILEEKLGIQ